MSASSDEAGAGQLARSVRFLCDLRNFGYAGLDCGYRAKWRYGELASWMPLGENVCRSTDLLFGLERELLDLQDENGSCFALPRVGIPSHADAGAKMSIEIVWDERAESYHVIIHRLVADSEVELELLKQIRARRLAEQNFQTTRERLARRQMLLDVIMQHLPIAAAIFDEKQRYVFATRRWGEDFRVECEPLLGRGYAEASLTIPAAEMPKFDASFSGIAAEPEIAASRPPNGDAHWHRWTHRPWRQEDGTNGGVLTSAEDLTALIERQKQLEAENERLRSTNRQLLNFAAIIAHDLKAPLRSLDSTIRELPAGRNGNGLAKALKHVERMASIIDGTQELTEALDFGSELEPVDLRKLVSEIFETLPKSTAFHLQLSLKREEVEIQKNLLDLVLRNLLDNAIKHHDRGAGRIAVVLDEDDTAWLLSVEDDGPGMTAERQDLLSAAAGPANRVERDNGSGLGLAIVRRALDRIGGTIAVGSDATNQRGTRLLVRWPKCAVSG